MMGTRIRVGPHIDDTARQRHDALLVAGPITRAAPVPISIFSATINLNFNKILYSHSSISYKMI
jgi:hypothetical protein